MKAIKLLWILIFGTVFFSCSRYTIPVESFKNQIEDVSPTSLEMVEIIGATGVKYQYMANQVQQIYCEDAKGNPVVVTKNPMRLVKLTYGEDNRTAVCYFDQIYVDGSNLVGSTFKLNERNKKMIPIDDIKKVEMQDISKGFQYNEMFFAEKK